MEKIAVIFPGSGYNTDKPLLYYSEKIAKTLDYKIVKIKYDKIDSKKDNMEDYLKESVENGYIQAKEQLSSVIFSRYDKIAFISKSLGTAIASKINAEYSLHATQIVYTPVPNTFDYEITKGIVFSGTKDPWYPDHNTLEEQCLKYMLPVVKIDGANHSLETDNPIKDIDTLKAVMHLTKEYLS